MCLSRDRADLGRCAASCLSRKLGAPLAMFVRHEHAARERARQRIARRILQPRRDPLERLRRAAAAEIPWPALLTLVRRRNTSPRVAPMVARARRSRSRADRVTRGEVVERDRVDELAARARHDRGLRVVGHQVEGQHVLGATRDAARTKLLG